jgi:tRNA pseudouridine38-40 synthase
MPTYRLLVEYDGSRYRGWQEQTNARTVAGELKDAIERVAGPVADLGGSGRTDAGVHAAAQTAHLRIARAMDPENLRDAVNEQLPHDIHLLAATIAPERFHARHAAVSRSYVYQIATRRTAFAKRFVWWIKRPLDAERMARAAAQLPGKHDFALFCERPADQTSTLVVVESAEVARAEGLILVRLAASHFLWKMVRRIVGTLVEIGSGRLDEGTMRALLAGESLPRSAGTPAEWTAPPSGLFLERVLYPGDPPLGPLVPLIPVKEEPVLPSLRLPERAERPAHARVERAAPPASTARPRTYERNRGQERDRDRSGARRAPPPRRRS